MRSNIKDVARRAGVSIATVSHVVNNTRYVSEEKKRRVLSAIEGLNYKPNTSARSLRSQKSTSSIALVCGKYACSSPRLLNRLLQHLTDIAVEQQWSMNVLFAEPNELIRYCREQGEYDHIFIVTDESGLYTGLLGDLSHVHYFDMGQLSVGDRTSFSGDNGSVFYAGLLYYRELSDLITDNSDGSCCFLMSLEQGRIMRDLFRDNVNYSGMFQYIRVVNSEISAAYIELMELMANEQYKEIYLTDYKFALGAVKLLLLKPELMHSKSTITFYNYDSVFEDFGLPVGEIPFRISKSSIEEIAGEALGL